MGDEARRGVASKVNVLAELDRLGWGYEPAGKDEVKCLCPAHEESTPSVSLNTEKKVWRCHACKAKGDIVSFIALAMSVERNTVAVELAARYGVDDDKVIDPTVIEDLHAAVWSAGPLLEELRKRGVTDDMIRAARIGFDAKRKRIAIPVRNDAGSFVNIRRYLPGAPSDQKMQNVRGFGKLRLYMPEQLKQYSTVWICGGELKALVAAALLNEHGHGAVSSTGGEGAWDPSFSQLFKGKHAAVCLDIDAAGVAGARSIATSLFPHAASVRILRLPLDEVRYPKGDINDWVGSEGANGEQLVELYRSAAPWQPVAAQAAPSAATAAVETTLSKARAPELVGKRVAFEAMVQAMDKTPYIVPRSIAVSCDRKQPNCYMCPVYALEPDKDTGSADVTVPASSDAILDMVEMPKSKLQQMLPACLGIPPCRSAMLNVKSRYHVTDLRLAPQLSIGDGFAENVVQPAYYVGNGADLNTLYRFSGALYPSPKNQQAALVLDSSQEVGDNLSSFDEESMNGLEIFRPTEWTVEALEHKLTEIYADLERNVTRIFSRQDLHIAVDLAYHSALYFKLDGKVANGWANVLILGDSSQGKSETTTSLMRHYGLGEKVECKNASVAGLLGGLQQMGNRWFVSWGVIPQHDKRLVILEEVKGMQAELLGRLTEMRSSGVAELPKIERRKTHARTRLLFISNPRSNRPVSAYSFGVDAVHELVGSLEDIRRFDMAIVLSVEQLKPEQINVAAETLPTVPHRYTSSLCRRRVLYAWTRQVEQVTLLSAAEELVFSTALKMCDTFSETVPLVDRGSMRQKLARLAVACAAMTFSTDDADRQLLTVRPCHVEFVARYLHRVYSDRFFGYSEFSRVQREVNAVSEPEAVRRRILGSKHPRDVVAQLLRRDTVTKEDMQDLLDVDRDEAQRALSFFVRKHCLYRNGQEYLKTSGFIELLKGLSPQRDAEIFEGEEL